MLLYLYLVKLSPKTVELLPYVVEETSTTTATTTSTTPSTTGRIV